MAQLRKKPTSPLGRLAFVTDGIHASIDYDSSSGIRLISAQSVKENRFDLSAETFISAGQHEKNLRTSLQVGDVIISSVGTIGNVAVVTKEMLPCNADRHVGIVRTNSTKLNPYFLAVFLNSQYGKFQTLREATGNVQLNLFIDKIKTLVIPLFIIANPVAEFAQKAEILFLKSEDFYFQAEQLLLSEIGLQNRKPSHTLIFERNYSQAAWARRMDAEHFQPKYADLRAHIRNYPYGYLKITDIATNSDETIEPRAQPKQEFDYIELAGINQVIGTVEGVNEIKGKDAPSRARMFLRAGDVIASTVEGSLDKVALVSEEYHGAIGSTGFFALRPRTVASGYLLALTKSIIVQEQMRCESSGTILAAVPAKSLRNIVVPNIPPDKQDKIAELVQQSHAARREAKAILEKAKRAVEIAIEENDDKAMELLNSA